MGLFKSNAAQELDALISRIEMNMANNYKDVAQSNLRKFETTFAEYNANSHLKEKEVPVYESLLGTYQAKLKGYTYKDQKPYWH
jgi:hypothetical protein